MYGGDGFSLISQDPSILLGRVWFATRYYQSAPVECSETTGKIHVRENSVSQGVVHACYHERFHDFGDI